MYQYVKEQIIPGKRMYLFFDEIQRIPAWENAINALRVDVDCDIYVTEANAYLLSSEYATYLAGRYVEEFTLILHWLISMTGWPCH